MTTKKKCGHAYYDRTAMTSMCDYYCTPCNGYRKACGQRKKEMEQNA